MDLVTNHASEIISAFLGFIGGALISVPITIRVTRRNMSGSSSNVKLSGVSAGGDVVGRDKISN
jgi:hypothetical protein